MSTMINEGATHGTCESFHTGAACAVKEPGLAAGLFLAAHPVGPKPGPTRMGHPRPCEMQVAFSIAHAISLRSGYGAAGGYNPGWLGRGELMTQENAVVVRRFVDEVITAGEIDRAAEFVWEDVVEQVPFPGQGPGLKGLQDALRDLRAAFPDLVFSIQEQIAEGDKVASRFEWTGTHQGSFLGVAATGRSVRVWGIVIDRLVEGRIKDTRIIMDSMGLMQQLGVLPGA